MNKEKRKVLEEATPNSDATRRENEKYVTLNGERINLGDAYQINATGESKIRKILPTIALAICILGMVVTAIAVIRNAYMNQEVSAGITRRESQEVHDGMSKQEVLDWATRTYGANNFIAEAIPHEDSIVTDHTGRKVMYSSYDPDVKDLVLDTGDTMVVVGPKYLDMAKAFIEVRKKSYHYHEEMSIYDYSEPSKEPEYPTPAMPAEEDLPPSIMSANPDRPTPNPRTKPDYTTSELPTVVPAGEWAGPADK